MTYLSLGGTLEAELRVALQPMLLVLMGVCIFVYSGVSLTLPTAALLISVVLSGSLLCLISLCPDKQLRPTMDQKVVSPMGNSFQGSPMALLPSQALSLTQHFLCDSPVLSALLSGWLRVARH